MLELRDRTQLPWLQCEGMSSVTIASKQGNAPLALICHKKFCPELTF
jgi:hypothetical protein